MSVDASVRAELARSLLAAAHDVESAMTAALRGTELGVPHYLVLGHLAEHEAASTSDLGKVALVPPATLTRAVDKLVDLTLVHRSLDGEDRRRILVRITERGRARLRECEPLIDDALTSSFPALREWEAQAMSDLLQRDQGQVL